MLFVVRSNVKNTRDRCSLATRTPSSRSVRISSSRSRRRAPAIAPLELHTIESWSLRLQCLAVTVVETFRSIATCICKSRSSRQMTCENNCNVTATRNGDYSWTDLFISSFLSSSKNMFTYFTFVFISICH